MFGKMDPKQMAAMMKQMGIKTEEIDAERVVIHKAGGGKIVIENPSVQAIDMRGQKSFQIAGSVKEEAGGEGEESGSEPRAGGNSGKEASKTDVDIIMEECGCTRDEAEQALEKADGDLAQAILALKGG